MTGRQELDERGVMHARDGFRLGGRRRQHRPQFRLLHARQNDLRPPRNLEARHEAPAAELDLGVVEAVPVAVDRLHR
jgi:hypothetical protein